MSVCTASSPSSFPSRRAGAAKRSRRSSTSTGLRTPRSPSQTSSAGWCATTTPMATSAWSSERTSCGRCRRSGRGNRASATPPGRQTRAATGSCWHDGYIDATRVDVWLWAVRLYKTRSAATAACRGGHVRVNRAAAKASTSVKVGDRVEAFVERERILEVVTVISKRVGAAVAATCLVDHSPPVPVVRREPPLFLRERGSGRPTKRDRRELDRLRRG